MEGNTTFGSVVWAVGQISRSDLVQVGIYGKCECLEGVNSILERINSILTAYFFQFQQQIWANIWVYGGKYHFWECCVGCRVDIAVRLGAGWYLWQV